MCPSEDEAFLAAWAARASGRTGDPTHGLTRGLNKMCNVWGDLMCGAHGCQRSLLLFEDMGGVSVVVLMPARISAAARHDDHVPPAGLPPVRCATNEASSVR